MQIPETGHEIFKIFEKHVNFQDFQERIPLIWIFYHERH